MPEMVKLDFWLFLLFFMALGYLITYLIFPKIIEMIKKAGFVQQNYRNLSIPMGSGIIFFITGLIVINIILVFNSSILKNALIFISALAAVTCFGLADDFWGSRTASGLTGHLKRLIKGDLTTGAVKAIGGILVALLVSLGSAPPVVVLVNVMVITLSINTINLLDLRPGRAVKGFILLALFLLLAGWGNSQLAFLFIIFGSVLAYLPWDLGSKTMMGDAGSNALGAVIGVTAIWVLKWPVKLIYLAFLVSLHLVAERYSITVIIEKNRFLNYLDHLGRRGS